MNGGAVQSCMYGEGAVQRCVKMSELITQWLSQNPRADTTDTQGAGEAVLACTDL